MKLPRIRDARRSLLFLYQRLTLGFDDSVTWNLDYSLAKLIAPRLRRFREVYGSGVPSSYITDHATFDSHDADRARWLADLDKMVWSFEWLASERRWAEDCDDKEILARVQEGLNLFSEHLMGMWT